MSARISFGIIVLNGYPFLRYNLDALYPFAHQIIVVEGATQAAKSLARPDGHSADGTFERLGEYKQKNDPEAKLQIISAQDEGFSDGFWPEKDEMSQAYARRATGDWLWQVDSDEFYLAEDMQSVAAMLEADPEITAVSFPYREFFGGFDYLINGKWHLVEHPRFHRLFRWGPGYRYVNHRPPTVLDEQGRDLRSLKWVSLPQRQGRPIYLYHYSYVLPKQAQQKVGYYSNVSWTDEFRGNQRWLEESYEQLKRPYFLSEKGPPIFQWLERYRGPHPEPVKALRATLERGGAPVKMRRTDDLERLVSSPIYWLLTRLLRLFMPPYWRLRMLLRPTDSGDSSRL